MFSTNLSISPTRLKPLDVAKERGNGVGRNREWGRMGRNGVGWGRMGLDGRERGRTGGGEWDRTGLGTGSDTARNGVGRGERGWTGGCNGGVGWRCVMGGQTGGWTRWGSNEVAGKIFPSFTSVC